MAHIFRIPPPVEISRPSLSESVNSAMIRPLIYRSNINPTSQENGSNRLLSISSGPPVNSSNLRTFIIPPSVQNQPRLLPTTIRCQPLKCQTSCDYVYQFTPPQIDSSDLRRSIDLIPRDVIKNLLYHTLGGNYSQGNSQSNPLDRRNWEVMLNTGQWRIKMDSMGCRLILQFYIDFPTWTGWSPSSAHPPSLEAIYFLNKTQLNDLARRLLGSEYRRCNGKYHIFRTIVDYLRRSNSLAQEEAQLSNNETFWSIIERNRVYCSDQLNRWGLGNIPGKNRVFYALEISKLTKQFKDQQVAVEDLLTMTESQRQKLAQKHNLTLVNETCNFSQLVRTLVNNRSLKSMFQFIETKEFWSFYLTVSEIDHHLWNKLAFIYLNRLTIDREEIRPENLTPAKSAALLYYHGILKYDLNPERLNQLSTNDTGFQRRNIPGFEQIDYPRGVVTKEQILATGRLTEQEMESYLRYTDLSFYDSLSNISPVTISGPLLPSPVDEFEIDEPLTSIQRSLPVETKYYTSWLTVQSASGKVTAYHFLNQLQLETILTYRNCHLSCDAEAIRQALQTIDQFDSSWLINVSNLAHDDCREPGLLYYKAASQGLILLNGHYSLSILKIAIKLKESGIATTAIKAPQQIRSGLDATVWQADFHSDIKLAICGHRTKSSFENHSWATKEQAAKELDLLIKYPPHINTSLYFELRWKNQLELISLVELLYPQPLDFVLNDRFELLFLLSRGYLFPHPQFQERKQRYLDLIQLPLEVQFLVLKYANKHNSRFAWLSLAINPPELLVKDFTTNGQSYVVDQLVQRLGVVVPGGTTLVNYLTTYWSQYQGLLTVDKTEVIKLERNKPIGLSQNNIMKLTDREIINQLGIMPIYDNRQELINNIRKLWYRPGFFRSIGRHAVNQETTYLTEIDDRTTEMIGYGTLDHYRGYELEELHDSFFLGQDKFFHFRHPENPDQNFSSIEIKQLLHLVEDWFNRSIGDTDLLSRLYTRIQEGLNHLDRMNYIDQEVYQQISQLPIHRQKLLQNWLQAVFDSGMYMRRWGGPGHPYPYTEGETLQYINPASKQGGEKIYQSFCQEGKIRSQLTEAEKNLLRRLSILNYQDNTYVREDRDIVDKFNRAANGHVCIRVTSRRLVISAARYLALLFDVNIPNFQPERVVEIS